MNAVRSGLLATTSLTAFMAMLAPSLAQTVPATAPENIGAVQGNATSAALTTTSAPTTAAGFAPSRPSLDQTQPTDTVGPEALRKFIIPTSNYDDIVALTPSAMDINPAGPGLQQDFGQSIRGLQYTEFSVLFDGIQLAPSPGNLSPQPAVFFMEHDLGSVTVNRGPGLSSDIGSATFGGFIAITTQPTSAVSYVEPYATFGSFGTKLYGLEMQSGDIAEMNGARVALDLSREEALGADTGLQTERRNLYFKYDQPVGQSTLITTYVNLDNDDTNTPYGTSLQSAQKYGANFSLDGDPTSQDFAGYNRDNYTSDLEYLRVHSDLGRGYGVEGTVYTQGYYHRGTQTADPGGDESNLINQTIYINNVATHVADDVQGTADKNDQRDWGALLRFTKDTAIGQGRLGVWFDHIDNQTYRTTIDFDRGDEPYATKLGASPFEYILFDTLTTVQPYGEFEFHPAPRLTVIAGVKYDAVTRSLQAPIDRSALDYQDDHAAFNRVLPAFSANYKIRKDLSVYAQAAKGYLTPPLNVFYTKNFNSVAPSSTWNFQVGSVYQKKWLDLGADLYYIEYNNYITSLNRGGGVVIYSNAGGAVFQGVETEATAQLGHGFALYANGTLNDSSYDSNGNNLAQTPRRTAALGLIYDKGNLFRAGDDLHGLIIAKNVGPQYGQDTSTVGKYDLYPIKSYNYVNLDAGYQVPVFKHRVTFDVQVYNLFNDLSPIGFAATSAGTPTIPLYWFDAGRSIFFSVSARI